GMENGIYTPFVDFHEYAMYPHSPFAFAVQAAPTRHISHWVALAREAEDLGYRSLLVPDHLSSGGPLTAMAVAGASTRSLRVGSLVLAADFQHPVSLVQELMTLDTLLDGRLEIGLGAGWMRSDYENRKRRMEPPLTRIVRLKEFVVEFRRLWVTSHESQRVT